MANGKQAPIYITEDGLRALREELDYLRTDGREQVAQRIGEAKAAEIKAALAGIEASRARSASRSLRACTSSSRLSSSGLALGPTFSLTVVPALPSR